jgi:Zn-dependent membrane protease YugP
MIIGSWDYLIFLAPAMLLMVWAQYRVQSTYARGMQVPAPLSGAAAARYILDREGLAHVHVEPTPGRLTDHYDPRGQVLRLSEEVYRGQTAAAVGIAAHEAGHALQHATNYAPLVLRNAAVPAASAGPTVFMVLLVLGIMLSNMKLIWLGIAAYALVLVFELINLPVEFDASRRAKQLLSELGIVDATGAASVRSVLNAAAWTYVARTLESLLTVLYYVSHFAGGSRARE